MNRQTIREYERSTAQLDAEERELLVQLETLRSRVAMVAKLAIEARERLANAYERASKPELRESHGQRARRLWGDYTSDNPTVHLDDLMEFIEDIAEENDSHE